jgi:hypothetical protein
VPIDLSPPVTGFHDVLAPARAYAVIAGVALIQRDGEAVLTRGARELVLGSYPVREHRSAEQMHIVWSGDGSALVSARLVRERLQLPEIPFSWRVVSQPSP